MFEYSVLTWASAFQAVSVSWNEKTATERKLKAVEMYLLRMEATVSGWRRELDVRHAPTQARSSTPVHANRGVKRCHSPERRSEEPDLVFTTQTSSADKKKEVPKARLKSTKPDLLKTSPVCNPLVLNKGASKTGRPAKPPRVAKQGLAQMAKSSKTLSVEIEDDDELVAAADAMQDEEAAKKSAGRVVDEWLEDDDEW